MQTNRQFDLLKILECTVPGNEVIKIYTDSLAEQYKALRLDPFIHANGSTPQGVDISPDLVPGRKLRIFFYHIRQSATTNQILTFLDNLNSLHLGALGLMLMQRFIPEGIFFMAFEWNDLSNAKSLRRNFDGTYQFMILKRGPSWDSNDGFVCIRPVDDDE